MGAFIEIRAAIRMQHFTQPRLAEVLACIDVAEAALEYKNAKEAYGVVNRADEAGALNALLVATDELEEELAKP